VCLGSRCTKDHLKAARNIFECYPNDGLLLKYCLYSVDSNLFQLCVLRNSFQTFRRLLLSKCQDEFENRSRATEGKLARFCQSITFRKIIENILKHNHMELIFVLALFLGLKFA